MSIAATRFGHTEGRVGLAYGKDGEKVGSYYIREIEM